MNKKQYNNVINYTLNHIQPEKAGDCLSEARAIFDNMGIALPQGDIKTVYETIKTDDYMGWRSCTAEEAQEAANSGNAAIGISEDRIVVISADDEDEPATQTASVMTLNENPSEYAEDGVEYYSYSYGVTDECGGSTITTTPVDYCGGSNYRDVTQHALELQNDGYYVCSRCGYRIKSPALQDKDILSSDDYLIMLSVMNYYAHNVLLAEKYPISAYFYNSEARNCKIVMDTIRSKSQYSELYEYQGANNKYLAGETDEMIASFASKSSVNAFTLGSYNGFYETIASVVIGYYGPLVGELADVISLLRDAYNGELDSMSFGAFIAGLLDLDDIALALSFFSSASEIIDSDVEVGDPIIRISFSAYASAEYIFDVNHNIKKTIIIYTT